MLWVLKKNVSMRRFFWAPNWWVRKYLQFYFQKFCLSKPVLWASRKMILAVQTVTGHLSDLSVKQGDGTYPA